MCSRAWTNTGSRTVDLDVNPFFAAACPFAKTDPSQISLAKPGQATRSGALDRLALPRLLFQGAPSTPARPAGPTINLVLYHGVLAPRAAWRALVVGFESPDRSARKSPSPPTPKSRGTAALLQRNLPAPRIPPGGQSPLGGVDAAQLRHRRARVPPLRWTPRVDRDHRRSAGDWRGSCVTWGCRRRSPSPVPPGLPRCLWRPERPVARGATGRHAPDPSGSRPVSSVRVKPLSVRPCTVGLPPYPPGESVRA